MELADTEQIEEIAQRHKLRLVLLFGSAASGKLHAGSDLDIAVVFADRTAAQREFFAVAAELQQAVPDREVDVALLNTADPLFLKQVLANCRLLFGLPRDLAELKMYAYKRYIDHKKYLALEEDYAGRVFGLKKKGAA